MAVILDVGYKFGGHYGGVAAMESLTKSEQMHCQLR